jgi:hypothetical protein
MKNHMNRFRIAICMLLMSGAVHAQQLPGLVNAFVLPKNATSGDNLKLTVFLENCIRYKADSYSVSMSNNDITVLLGLGETLICSTIPRARSEFDIGRLLAGSYTITLIEAANDVVPRRVLIDKAPFTVADARIRKQIPYVRLDYSGAWWDPNDSGWGLFIWQDASGPTDSLLAAWFTYAPDGKPMWYVFQPLWLTDRTTSEAPLLQTSRPPGTNSPPPGVGTSVAVGTASLDFTNFGTGNEGKLTYTFTNGTKLTRTIQRLKP